jgi:hypothetical protein
MMTSSKPALRRPEVASRIAGLKAEANERNAKVGAAA